MEMPSSPDLPPLWLIVSGSIAGLTTAIIQIVYALKRILSAGVLEVTLTKEVFFRITEYGENIFAHAVFVARNDFVEIREVSFTLSKVDQPTKNYKLSVLYTGEKVHGKGVFAENSFHSKSSIAYVPKDIPQKAVYLAVLDGYEAEIKRKINDFTLAAEPLKLEFQRLKNDLASPEANALVSKFQEQVKSATNIIFDKIQIEKGEFTLAINVKYRRRGLFGKSICSASSSIKFQIEDIARDMIYSQLEKTLNTILSISVFSSTELVTYPEYAPVKMSEQ